MFNLILGSFWCLGACGVFAVQALRPEFNRYLLIQPFGQTMSIGWLMLVLALFNFVRWYAQRKMHAERRARRELEVASERDRRALTANRQPDPTFVFVERPQPPPS